MNPQPLPLDNEFVISYFKLRKAIGVLGLLMPILVRLGAWWREGILSNESISAYYYTSMRDVFVGIMVATGVFLFCYRGPDRQDNILTNIAGPVLDRYRTISDGATVRPPHPGEI